MPTWVRVPPPPLYKAISCGGSWLLLQGPFGGLCSWGVTRSVTRDEPESLAHPVKVFPDVVVVGMLGGVAHRHLNRGVPELLL